MGSDMWFWRKQEDEAELARLRVEVKELRAQVAELHQQMVELDCQEALHYAEDMGALYNLLFPFNIDDWDYPAQMFRYVWNRVVSLVQAVEKHLYEFTIEELEIIRGEAGCDPYTLDWKDYTYPMKKIE